MVCLRILVFRDSLLLKAQKRLETFISYGRNSIMNLFFQYTRLSYPLIVNIFLELALNQAVARNR